MSETSGESSMNSEEVEKKKKASLDDKSKEELIQIVRKQLSLLQKAKGKSDELNKKCSILEDQVEKLETNEKEYQNQIENLKQEIKSLRLLNSTYTKEKEQDIIDLNEKIDILKGKELTSFSVLSEKDERIECLSMQLDTMKKTCQCYQEELTKYQKTINEMDEKVHILTTARDTALESLKVQSLDSENKFKDYSNLLDESTELKNKYSICIEENCSLSSKIKELEQCIVELQSENKKLQLEKSVIDDISKSHKKEENIQPKSFATDELTFLITDNQNLVSELNRVMSENEGLKKKFQYYESEKGNESYERSSKQLQDSQPSEQISKIKQELMKSQKNLFDIGSENSKLKYELKNFEQKFQSVQIELEELKNNKKAREEKYEICLKEKLNLENEIKKLSSFFKDVTDFQTGYEFALLHGAESGCLENHSLQKDSKLEVKNNISSDEPNKNLSSSIYVPPDMNSFSMGGFECALLDGGSVSEVFESYEFSELTPSFENYADNMDSKKASFNNNQEMKVDNTVLNEIILLRQRIEVYAQSLKESLDEKESLKLKLKEHERENYTEKIVTVEAFTNTDSEFSQDSLILESMAKIKENEDSLQHLKNKNSEMMAEISSLESKFSVSVKDQDSLQNEVNILKIELKNSHQEIEQLIHIKKDLESILNDIREQNLQLREKLAEISDQHKKYDLELEILVPHILGILTQFNFSPSQANYPNDFDSFKLLLKELVTIFSVNCDEVKQLESHLENCENQKQELEEKFCHIEELNKFLEEEVKALQDELENIKCDSNYYNKNYENFCETKCLSSPSELYSIEETNETDDRATSIDNEALESLDNWQNNSVAEIDTAELSGQSKNLPLKNNYYLSPDYIAEVPECNITNNNALKSEIFDLKDPLRSNVNRINDLENDLNLKEEEIFKLNNLISKLQRQIQESSIMNETYKTTLIQINNLKNILKNENSKFLSEIASSKILHAEEWSVFVHKISSSIVQINEKFNVVYQKSVSLEKIMEQIKLYFQKASNDFDLLIMSFENSNKEFSLSEQIALLNKVNLEQSSHIFMNSDCENELVNIKCILSDIKTFESNKQKLFNLLSDHIITTEKSLSSFKEQVIFSNLNPKKSDISLEEAGNNTGNEEVNSKNQLLEAETKLKKLKQISLKLKKELEESKKQTYEITTEKEKIANEFLEFKKRFENISREQYHCMQNYQSLQTEYDKTQDELEVQKENLKKLQDDLATTLMELNSLKEKISEKDSQLVKSKEMLESAISTKEEVEKKYMELESKLIISETKHEDKIAKLKELEATIENNENNLKTILDENNNLKNQLAQISKEESKKTLMDLEMADYERSVSELNSQLQTKDVEIADLKLKLSSEVEKIQSLLEEIKSTETIKETEEKRAANLKEILEKTKTELLATKEQEATLLANVSSLKLQLEVIVQQEENYKLQLSESSAEIQHLKEMIKTSSENHQRIIHSLESKISSQKQEILCSHKEIESVKQEFENYKIRVHSVLRQQKSVTTLVAPTDLDLKEKFEVMVEKSKIQIKDLSEKLTAISLEHETLQEEYENLLQRYNKAMDEKATKEREWHTKLEQINTEKNQLRLTQENLSSQHLLQNEMLVSTYKKQIKIMSDEHKRTVNEFQKQLESADLEISRLQRDQQKTYGTPASSVCHDNPIPFDILSQERQEGEGSECTDGASTPLRQLSLSTIPTSGFMSFEKLLQSPLEPGTPTSFLQCLECERLLLEINVTNKKIDHISEVLNDSESSNLRLSEQVRVLKEEVRRLERNKEREQHAENLEYLKNVFIKFSTLNPSAEKAMLIPVLTTMLKLSPSEQQQLKNIAGDGDPDDASNSGWGSYLHRWSGLA